MKSLVTDEVILVAVNFNILADNLHDIFSFAVHGAGVLTNCDYYERRVLLYMVIYHHAHALLRYL